MIAFFDEGFDFFLEGKERVEVWKDERNSFEEMVSGEIWNRGSEGFNFNFKTAFSRILILLETLPG